jgi:hypothetical protein
MRFIMPINKPMTDIKKPNTENIVKKVQSLTLTKELYRLKKRGQIPTIRVRQNPDGSLMGAVTMKVGPITYYFHGTKQDGKDVPIETYMEGDIKWTTFPFDGWDVFLGDDEDKN